MRDVGEREPDAKFSGRLGGDFVKPATATRSLTPENNICHFSPIKDGDAPPKLGSSELLPGITTGS